MTGVRYLQSNDWLRKVISEAPAFHICFLTSDPRFYSEFFVHMQTWLIERSNWQLVNSGVPQGLMLGPTPLNFLISEWWDRVHCQQVCRAYQLGRAGWLLRPCWAVKKGLTETSGSSTKAKFSLILGTPGKGRYRSEPKSVLQRAGAHDISGEERRRGFVQP